MRGHTHLPMKRFLRSVLFAVLGATLLASPAFAQRMANLSTRTPVGSGANVAVVGFVVGPGSAKNILVRAIGPTIAAAPFNVPGTISDPKIDIADATGRIVFSNDNWSTTTVGGTTTFASVGAFNLTTNSRDAAILATNLAPGAYTATVSGVGTASGVALVEVYDVSGAARLMNLSTRAQVGTGSGIIISGLVISPGDGRRQILVRAAGPALAGFGVPGALADPVISIVNNSAPTVQVASNDNWGTNSNVASLNAAFTQSGAFAFAPGSKDAALITDLAPGSYSIQVSGADNSTGLALVEVYDITPDQLATVAVVSTNPATDTKGAAPGTYSFTRTGPTAAPLTAYYQVSGTAAAGVDFAPLSGTITFPAGVSTVSLNLTARSSGSDAEISRTATVSLVPGAGYSVAASNVASVTILYNPGTNYIASLRTSSTATASTAYGTATIQLSGDSTFAVVNLNFSGLSSPQTVAYLRLGTPNEVGTEVLRLPNGQVTGQRWTFPTEGALTAAQIVQAIKDGRIFLSIESSSYPSGELKGSFIQNNATLAFTAPPSPALLDTALTAAEAARFLTQTTFGPTKAEIDALTGKRLADLNTWITAQMALTASLHLDATRADFNVYTVASSDNPQFSTNNRQAAWWKLSVSAPDQLRQRVAFALSQILVVSDVPGTLFNNPIGMANYYDLLVNGAFGNFRQLLENVSLSPVMGFYLSSLRNAKATFDARTGAALTSADENYAREIMQLFTIGLNQLQPDGTLKLDPSGVPIPTYDQKTITEVAKVFTGWAFASDTTNVNNFRGSAANYLAPMVAFPTFHDDSPKTLFNGIQLGANQGPVKDLKDTLDALVNHPNTGPFISRQLIQRLVTSNPSPGYVYRVAQKFADDGTGTRGNLGAVVRAILTDYEARSAAVAASASFGKLKEPLLRATAILRAFNGNSNWGRYQMFVGQGAEGALGQTPMHAPTVFNFFEPNYVQPGVLAASGLYAPEYQILNDTTAISAPNQLWNFIYANRSTTNTFDTSIGIQLDSLLPLARTPAALVDQANLILAGGALPKAVTDRFTAAITALPIGIGATFNTANDIERVRSALYLTVSVPQGAIQK